VNTEYHFDKLNFGGSLECLLHSFLNDEQVLLIERLYPFELDTFEYSEEVKFLGYDNKRKIYKSEMWDRLTFLMSMTGQIIMPNIVVANRREKNKVTLVTEHNKRITIGFDKAIVFEEVDYENVDVYDWFHVRSGNNHQYNIIEDNAHKFVHTLHFYRPNRIGSNSNKRDVCAASHMPKDELNSPHCTEGMARLKALKMMKNAGINGQSNGYRPSGAHNYYPIKIEHAYRETQHRYKPVKTLESIIENRKRGGRSWNLAKKLFRHKQISTLQESYQLPASL
jgi:hypothetical protein